MRTALITGGSVGIGRATATRLAQQGFGVVLTYRGHAEEAHHAAAQIQDGGGTATTLHLDLDDTASFAPFVNELLLTLQSTCHTDRLDLVVNNAGIGGGAPFAETSQAEFDRFHQTLVRGPFFLTQRPLPVLRDGAAIVNTGSTSALPTGTESGYAAYAAQKGAMHVLTRCWAKELAPRGIRVNCVAPGSTRTRIAGDAFDRLSAETLAGLASTVALGRVGEPDDIAGAIAFLAGPESGWITGEILECSGGQRL